MTNLFANVAACFQSIVWVAIVLLLLFFGWIGLTFLSVTAAQAFAVRRQGDDPEAHGSQWWFDRQDHDLVGPGGRTGYPPEDRIHQSGLGSI